MPRDYCIRTTDVNQQVSAYGHEACPYKTHFVKALPSRGRNLEHFRLSQIHNITLLIANAKANTPVSVKT